MTQGHSSGITWLELQVALLLDDEILQHLIHEVKGRGWPGLYSEKADPVRIMKALRTAIRSVIPKSENPSLSDMGTRIPRLKGWGIYSGLACLQGAPVWPPTLISAVKSTILSAHARDEEDRQRLCSDHKLTARPIALQGFEKWLTQRAWAHSDPVLRSATRAAAISATNDKTRAAPTASSWTSSTQDPQRDTDEDSKPHLHHGENWFCHWCMRRFEGDLHARPPKGAPKT